MPTILELRSIGLSFGDRTRLRRRVGLGIRFQQDRRAVGCERLSRRSRGAGALLFHPVPPCRVADTRDPTPRPLGGPVMAGDSQRTFPVSTSSCGIPPGVQAYSLNVTVVPTTVLSFVTLGPSGQARPFVSTLNDFAGIILANAAIVPAGK